MSKKIVKVIGGLGNQMFQRAFAEALKIKFPKDKILLDISDYRKNNAYNHNGFELNRVFGNQMQLCESYTKNEWQWYKPRNIWKKILYWTGIKNIIRYNEKKFLIYDPQVFEYKDRHDIYYSGFWQSPLYFDEYREVIQKLFSFPKPKSINLELSERMKEETSICIHVRRGDYEGTPYDVCNLDYYKNAIDIITNKLMNNNLSFYIFSDDIEWCKKNISPLLDHYKQTFVSHNKGENSYWDMYLMSQCKGLIIPNSTFSWWAAYLSNSELVVTPKQWMRDIDYDAEIYCKKWIKA